ncbi:LytTR family DNA-binding domain-containing protein [Dyadobacter sp. CY261]|uniref:LytR/AlgR family response regulator transcription factor n=1 Tax=Dyadobacter sp. CY261 TaxID=2907203 RepID=UPI001F248155|nr:LytTR family DNA-binding domain-containing protein [Dyadobacter sp. CY261]MCF0071111.1 LytTR family DNA-binding domain-containing protein [Dyadobacter sp. CY261]
MPNLLRCAIIEDEPLAQELLEKYVRRVSFLELAGTFDDAIAAFTDLPGLAPHIVFLDINMPEMSGIEFLKALPAPHPVVVMTTANPHHALEGFDLGVADYLLKPITFDRFLKAIGRIRERFPATTNIAEGGNAQVADISLQEEPVVTEPGFAYFKTDKRIEQVLFADIEYVEALGDYLRIFLPDRNIVTHLTIKKLLEILPAGNFIRTHRSHIVQLRHIRTMEGNTLVLSSGKELLIGPNYRDEVRTVMKKWLANS